MKGKAIYIKKLPQKAIILVGLVLSFVIAGCGDTDTSRTPRGHTVDHRKPMAWGHEQVIYVFADDNIWSVAEQPLRESIERYYYTTENETYFDLKRGDFKDFSHFYRFKNILFLGHLDSHHEVSRYVKNTLADNAIQSVIDNNVGLFTRSNLWANEQFVVFMLGENKDSLLNYNKLVADDLFDMFKNKLYSYLERRIFRRDVYSPSFFRSFPWNMQVPENYIIREKDEENNFILFLARRRDNADRYIGVYYEHQPENKVNLEWAKETRAKLAWDYHDEDEFSEEDLRSRRMNFAGYDGIKIAGRWQNHKYAIGGAFRSFAFYDEETETAWLIDNSVFFPEGYKLPALIEMEIISRTFSVDPISDI